MSQQYPPQQPYYPPQQQPKEGGISTGFKFVIGGCLAVFVLGIGGCMACGLLLGGAANMTRNSNLSSSNSSGGLPPSSSDPNPNLSNTESTSRWTATELTSEMDSSKGYAVALKAENQIDGWLKKSIPELYIRCKEGKIDLYVNIEMAAAVEYGGGNTVRLRYDEAQPIKQKWSQSTDNEALFCGSGSIAVAKKIAQAKTFKFEFVPFNGSTQVAQFDVRGFQPHLDKLLSTCKKK